MRKSTKFSDYNENHNFSRNIVKFKENRWTSIMDALNIMHSSSYELVLGAAFFLNPFTNPKKFVSKQLKESIEKYIENELLLLGDLPLERMRTQERSNNNSIFNELYDKQNEFENEYISWKKIM